MGRGAKQIRSMGARVQAMVEETAFYATTADGIEDVAAVDLQKLGAQVEAWKTGRVYFRAPFPFFYRANSLARSIHRIVILLKRAKAMSLDEIYETARSLELSFIRPEQAFAVRPRRLGQHPFTSQEIGRVVGQAVIDASLQAFGQRLRVNLDDPDVALNAELLDDDLLLGIDTTGDVALSKRGYRAYQHPATLNPAVASGLIDLSGWDPSCSLLDPMCGSGTILIEAALKGWNVPPGRWRTAFAFQRLAFFDGRLWEQAKEEADAQVSQRPLQLLGIDRGLKHVKGARMNAEQAGVGEAIHIRQGDCTKDPLPSVEIVITNPPYGVRVGKRRLMAKLYGDFLDNLRRWAKKATKVLFITGEYRAFAEVLAARDLPLLHERGIVLGDLPTRLFVFHVG
ncbi:MAG: class I SAM-dependent RNA methyltransferase [candidate division NC10 bacterium]|nr:class I SAM-dependent RNA methyltransferase [candidate division NC10 bacterium]